MTDPSAAYFVDWVRQQIVNHFGQRAFIGGLKVKTTLDLDLQQAAVSAVQSRFSDPSGPTASLVCIDNKTGEVRAMVGGPDYKHSSFNLATQGQRQPGSSFKAFVLAAALQKGYSPDSVWASQQKEFTVPHSGGKEVFQVHNFEGEYAGSRSLWDAIAQSDNSVFAELGIKTGIGRIVSSAYRMGIRTPISHNYAITLGGLRQGVTPLDMAHAYETIQQGGLKITNRRLGAEHAGPVGIHEVRDSHNNVIAVNDHPNKIRAIPKRIADDRDPDARGRHDQRHRNRRGNRRIRGRQDRHDRELGRRVVRRLQPEVHDGHLGRLSRQAPADADRVRRQRRSRARPSRPTSGTNS